MCLGINCSGIVSTTGNGQNSLNIFISSLGTWMSTCKNPNNSSFIAWSLRSSHNSFEFGTRLDVFFLATRHFLAGAVGVKGVCIKTYDTGRSLCVLLFMASDRWPACLVVPSKDDSWSTNHSGFKQFVRLIFRALGTVVSHSLTIDTSKLRITECLYFTLLTFMNARLTWGA